MTNPHIQLQGRAGMTLAVGTGNSSIMGILNITPDSFFDGGQFFSIDAAWQRAEQMIQQGADVIDVGGESSRPGATALSAEEEKQRLFPVFQRIAKCTWPVIWSIDTQHAQTAYAAVDCGIQLLNLPFPRAFLSQFPSLSEAVRLIRQFQGIVIMHSRGNPDTMKLHAKYNGPLVSTLILELRQTVHLLLKEEPDIEQRILYDPGLGFAKDAWQTQEVLRQLPKLKQALHRPMVVGTSRKSFLGHFTGLPVEKRLIPSVVATLWAVEQGADLVRVHDVWETKQALSVWQQLKHPQFIETLQL